MRSSPTAWCSTCGPSAGGTKFDFRFHLRYRSDAVTAPSLLYDYYNPENRAIVAPTRFIVH